MYLEIVIENILSYMSQLLSICLNVNCYSRYLQSWVSHGLVMEYYEEGALVRDPEITSQLPGVASGNKKISLPEATKHCVHYFLIWFSLFQTSYLYYSPCQLIDQN